MAVRRASSKKAIAAQAVFALALAVFIALVAYNTAGNLERAGMSAGFGFLDHSAGFAISQTLIPYDERSTYARALVVGLLNTLLVSSLGVVLATILGFAIGIARLSKNWLAAKLALAYVETLRNLPLLLQLFVWYFAVLQALPPPRLAATAGGVAFLHNRGLTLPAVGFGGAGPSIAVALVFGLLLAVIWGRYCATLRRAGRRAPPTGWPQMLLVLGLPLLALVFSGAPVSVELPVFQRFNFRGGVTLRPEFLALVISLTTYTAAFIAEIVRAGLLAVPRGQREAAEALGLSRAQVLRFVIVPQSLRVILPPLANQYLNLIKNSSLAVAIAYPDLVSVFAGTALSQSGRALEIIAITMAIYLALSLGVSALVNAFNARVMREGGA